MLTAFVQDSLTSDAGALIPALRRGRPEDRSFASALGLLAARGAGVRWNTVFPGARAVELPGYAFQRQRYWLEDPGTTGDAAGLGLTATGHPLLGAAVTLAGRDEHLVTGRLSRHAHPWLADHAVGGTVLVPGTGLLELALRAGEQIGALGVDELTLAAPLVLPERGAVQVQVVAGATDQDGGRPVRIYSRPDTAVGEAEGEWVLHAQGRLATAGDTTPPASTADGLPVWPPAGATETDLTGPTSGWPSGSTRTVPRSGTCAGCGPRTATSTRRSPSARTGGPKRAGSRSIRPCSTRHSIRCCPGWPGTKDAIGCPSPGPPSPYGPPARLPSASGSPSPAAIPTRRRYG